MNPTNTEPTDTLLTDSSVEPTPTGDLTDVYKGITKVLDGQYIYQITKLPDIAIYDNLNAMPKRLHNAPIYKRTAYEGTGRNSPCPCGSGRKFKRCCAGKP